MNKTLQLVAIAALVTFTTFNSSVFADVKYNPFNNSWEQTSPRSELKYNNFNNSWNYEAPESTMQYNSFENSWDYCCYE